MAHTVYYDTAERYDQGSRGIVIPLALRLSPGVEVRLTAKIDTGADYCLFQRLYAEHLGLPVEEGHPLKFSTVNGEFEAFGHEVTIVAMGFELHGTCYFFKEDTIAKNVLGRNGWLNKVRLGIDDTSSPGLLYAGLPGE